jgi:hypothetical protein
MTEEEFHEELPDELSIKAAPRLCPKCGQIKPLRDFERPLTKAQAAYRGFANKHTVYITSKFCRLCQPGRYKPTKMTVKDIRRAAYNGRVSMQRAEIDVQKKQARSYETKKRAVVNRWHKAKAAPWLTVRANVADELSRAGRTAAYYKKADKDKTYEFFTAYADALRVIRSRCTIYAKIEEPIEEGVSWHNIAMRCGVDVNGLRDRWYDLMVAGNKVPLLFKQDNPLQEKGENSDGA